MRSFLNCPGGFELCLAKIVIFPVILLFSLRGENQQPEQNERDQNRHEPEFLSLFQETHEIEEELAHAVLNPRRSRLAGRRRVRLLRLRSISPTLIR